MKVPKAKKLPSGAYRVQVMVNGQRVSITDDDPKVAQAKAAAVKAKLQEAEKSPRAMTVGEAIDRYIENKDAVLSPATIDGYKKMRKNVLQDIMNIKLPDLTQENVQKSINKLAKKRSPKYVRNAHGLLSATLKEYRPSMVLHTTLPQKEKKEIAIPTTEEINLIAQKIKGTRFELPFLLAAWMGLRTSEIRGLTWDCVQDEVLHIKQAVVYGENGPSKKITKSYSGNRKLPLPKYIKELIESQPKNDEYIIHYSRNAMYNQFQKVCTRCKLPHYRFHDLRHYQASVMLALGVPDKYAMERMGHASTHMLKNVYQHTMKKKSVEVAALVDNYFEENLHTKLHTETEDT